MPVTPSTVRRILVAAFFSSLLLVPASARLGETQASVKKRMGRADAQVKNGATLWLLEVPDGQIAYTVTFNAKGESIAEGLKPLKTVRLPTDMAQDFIETQLAGIRGSKTLAAINPGEKYRFAGQDFVCGEGEAVWVDEANGILVVWMRSASSVMAVSREMLQAK